MKKFLSILAAMMIAILAIVPMVGANAEASTGMTNVQMYVNSSNGKGVNLRAQPSTDARLIAKLGEGKPVKMIGYVSSDWCEVMVQLNGSYKTGYVMTKFVSTTDPVSAKQTFKAVTPFTVTVTPSNGARGSVNMRAKASTGSTIVEKLYKGDTLTVIAASKAWYKVVDTAGNTGYVVKAFVQK